MACSLAIRLPLLASLSFVFLTRDLVGVQPRDFNGTNATDFHDGSEQGRTIYMGVNPNIGGFDPPKWMKIMENPIKIDDFGGKTRFLEKCIRKHYSPIDLMAKAGSE